MGRQGQTRLRSETLASNKVKLDTEEGPKELEAEQNKAQDEKAKVSAKAGTNSRQPLNRAIRFPWG
jgi:hypothetical protein